ncbi:O-antigen polymerase [Aeromonas caviae]|uniref:O-antigen polymerase n=1 Tax=Aeromonas caviae TaxID=648 RepID=UPI0038D04A24
MRISLLFIGLIWLTSLAINLSGIISYKALSVYTIILFMYVTSVILLFPIFMSPPPEFAKSISPYTKKINIGGFSFLFIYLIPISILMFSVFKSHMLTMSFTDYFSLRRGGEIDGGGLVTGISFVDTLLKVYVYPALVSFFLILVSKVHVENKVDVISFIGVVFGLVVYTYLFQVNYPVIFLIIVLFFLFLNNYKKKCSPIYRHRNKSLFVLIIFVCGILFSAANRFGSFDILGIIMYYPMSYFSLGISVFDLNFKDETSILHNHTYGLNLLGHILLPLKYIFSFLGFDNNYFNPPSIENTLYLNEKVDVGYLDFKYVNAFGTVLFSFYKDFNVLGIALAPLIYVFSVQYVYYKYSITSIALFYLLLFNGVSGLTVSPLDQPHFIFSIVIIYLVTKEFRWKR